MWFHSFFIFFQDYFKDNLLYSWRANSMTKGRGQGTMIFFRPKEKPEEGQEENMDFPVSCRHIYHGNRHRNFLLDKARK